MDRAAPVSNKLISNRINERSMQIHLSKLSNIKSSINQKAPQSFSHLKSNKKKAQVNEDKMTEIERKNKLLLNRLTGIMKPSNSNLIPDRNAGKSLNREVRKRELVKINTQNQELIKRLQGQRSIYDRKDWVKDSKQHDVYLRRISEYPVVVQGARLPKLDEERPQTYQIPRNNRLPTPGGSTSNNNSRFSSTSKISDTPPRYQSEGRKRSSKLEPLETASSNVKRVLFSAKRKIGFSTYTVDVYLDGDTFNVVASNNERADYKLFTCTLDQGEELVNYYEGDIDMMLSQIKFKGPRIVFENVANKENGLNTYTSADGQNNSAEKYNKANRTMEDITENKILSHNHFREELSVIEESRQDLHQILQEEESAGGATYIKKKRLSALESIPKGEDANNNAPQSTTIPPDSKEGAIEKSPEPIQVENNEVIKVEEEGVQMEKKENTEVKEDVEHDDIEDNMSEKIDYLEEFEENLEDNDV